MNTVLRIARVAVVLAAIIAVAALLRNADRTRVWALLVARGPIVALALLPFLAAMAIDTAGWRVVLARLGRRIRYRPLLRIRLATEGAMLSLPGGSVAAEALKPILLNRLHGVPIPDGAASVVIKKALVILTNGVYLALGVVVGGPFIRAGAPAAAPMLTIAGITGSVVCVAIGVGAVLALRGGPWWRRRFPRLAPTADLAAGFFTRNQDAAVLCFFLFLLVWLVEALETFVIARLLGLPLTLGGALGFESLIALGRAVGFFLPAGLGVQDLGHLLLARAIGGTDADTAGAALIFTKRSKEVFWIVTGALLLSGTKGAKASDARSA
jgi:hypothetical protein